MERVLPRCAESRLCAILRATELRAFDRKDRRENAAKVAKKPGVIFFAFSAVQGFPGNRYSHDEAFHGMQS
jgi:hypothetical protein